MIRKKGTRKDKRGGVKREHHNIPDDIDVQLNQEQYEKFASKLTDGKAKPITENHLKNIIRSAVRKKWMHCDVKLAFLHSKCVPDYDPNTRRRFKVQCNMCKEWFTKTDVDVDHIKGEFEFTDLSQAHQWASSILDVGFDDLQILCNKTCHPIKTLAERNGISIEDAKFLRDVIAWENDKSLNHKQICLDLGADKKQAANKANRREFYLQYLKTVDTDA